MEFLTVTEHLVILTISCSSAPWQGGEHIRTARTLCRFVTPFWGPAVPTQGDLFGCKDGQDKIY